MTARSWQEGDPEPPDHPPLVDAEGVTWLWDDSDPYDIPGYVRRMVTRYPHPDGGPGVVLGSSVGFDWEEILTDYGPVREATAAEAAAFLVTFAAKPLGVS